ncbi:hypothetical protein ED733_000025 [Metarhizium rileyi]|uniref:PD-(D/E)XK nuclease-like domain-containing protein n=1 Tax=Metarhizium rileyi (strain RCEF 4871) TaxID=1649241 RepID=A0A5C6FZJ3_METRR|nr:hypothetical protein ED733_000025 [Metarhizium rileyi]
MDFAVIQAWIDEVTSTQLAAVAIPSDPLPNNACRPSDEMPGPSKRQRTSGQTDAYTDPDETPTRPGPQRRHGSDSAVFDGAGEVAASTPSASSFTAMLASRTVFSVAATESRAPTESSYIRAESRSKSPTKRFRKTTDLLNLARPVRFMKECDLDKAVPSDVTKLFEALSIVAAKEQILPAILRSHADFQGARIRSFMWTSTDTTNDHTSANDKETALREHAHLRRIVDDSIASSNLHRSEAAWNCLVHSPYLQHATRCTEFLDVEPITSAQILPAFRPLFNSNEQAPATASLSNASSASGQTRLSSYTSSSVHKMVDFALVIRPEANLQRLIDEFLAKQRDATATINQTRYEPLRTRPAPIFIETKVSSGTMEDANVQLGIWVAAWHQRMRSIIALGGVTDKIITIPVVQVVGGVWTLLFVVDAGTEITVLDDNFRIGDTDSIIGVYQLQAAMSALAGWVKDTFQPWFTTLLTRANG